MSNQYTTTETQISINISTGCLHDEGNRFEEARQQIERSAFYLQSIFNQMRRSAQQLEASDSSTLQELGTDFMNFSEIGYGIAETVFLSLKVFYDVEQKARDEARGGNGEPLDGNIETFDVKGLSLAFAGVLNNEHLPLAVSKSINHALNDLAEKFSFDVDRELVIYGESPELLEKLFTLEEAAND